MAAGQASTSNLQRRLRLGYGRAARIMDELEKMGLAVPEVKYLMRALKKRYPEIDDDIFTVEAAKVEIERVFGGERDV